MVCEQRRVKLGEVISNGLKLHFHYSCMAGGGSKVEGKRTREVIECLLCGELGKELLNDVGGCEFRFDVIRRVFLHVFDSKLFGMSRP